MEHKYYINEDNLLIIDYEIISSLRKNEGGTLTYNIYNNELTVCDINTTSSIDDNKYTGTDLIIELIKYYQNKNIIFSRIHGRFSSTDAKEYKWEKSIPFFRGLPKHILQKTGLKYSFHLYYDIRRKIELTDCFTEECIPILIYEHLINNTDMSFDLTIEK